MFFNTPGKVLGLNGCIVNAKINCLFNKNFWCFFEKRMEHKEPFLFVPFVFSFPKEVKKGKQVFHSWVSFLLGKKDK